MDRSDASTGLAFLVNGAKETRTPDPLHAMQVHFAAKYLSPLTYRKSNKFFRAIFRAELACRPSLPKQPIRHIPQLRDVARDLLATSSLDRHLQEHCGRISDTASNGRFPVIHQKERCGSICSKRLSFMQVSRR